MTKFLYKWLWCSWMHRKYKCYPEIWGRGLNGPWHCAKCHKCGEGLSIFLGEMKLGWL